MRKLMLMTAALALTVLVERRADKLGISPRAVVLGAVQHLLNRLSGRTAPVRAEAAT